MSICRLSMFVSVALALGACGVAPTANGQAFTSSASDPTTPEDDADDSDAEDDDDAPPEDDGEDSGDPTTDPDTGEDDSGDRPPDGSGLPCDVKEVLAENCWMCHADPPKFGAPMAAASHEDFQVPAPTDVGSSVAKLTDFRINDPADGMPPAGQLAPAKLQILNDWIAAGTPRYEGDDCDEADVPDTDGVGPESLPCEPTHEFRAHAPGGGPFQVPDVDDLYMCYTFNSPFPAGAQVTAYAPIIGDERVLHHWILYKTATDQVDGGAGPCQMPLDAQFVAGWAPGGDNAVMPEDVGLEIASPSESLILQVHYNNVVGYPDALDESGVAMCITETPRPNLAGVLWLGNVLIEIPPGAVDHPVQGTCSAQETSSWQAPFNVMSSSPHMHELGSGFKTEIYRQGGGMEVLIDEPNFSFENQKDYPYSPPIVINPGDELRSTCFFDNPGNSTVYFGEGTSDEMCFNFVVGYPIDKIPDRLCGILF